jgi:hypothetical protein
VLVCGKAAHGNRLECLKGEVDINGNFVHCKYKVLNWCENDGLFNNGDGVANYTP